MKLLFSSSRKIVALTTCSLFLWSCQPNTGANFASNVYSANQVNQEQDAKTVKILAVMPAKIEVENKSQQQAAQLIGGLLGAIGWVALGTTSSNYKKEATLAGGLGGGALGATIGKSMIGGKVLADGVSITYVNDDGKTKNSAQVGKLCEYQPGVAVVIATSAKETRVQPNTSCTST